MNLPIASHGSPAFPFEIADENLPLAECRLEVSG
tara:strand:+ start:144 stop:245 length:102 start_codon:yes stop_codon:yes gene_type:complete